MAGAGGEAGGVVAVAAWWSMWLRGQWRERMAERNPRYDGNSFRQHACMIAVAPGSAAVRRTRRALRLKRQGVVGRDGHRSGHMQDKIARHLSVTAEGRRSVL